MHPEKTFIAVVPNAPFFLGVKLSLYILQKDENLCILSHIGDIYEGLYRI
jgi:hypothetical protein